MDFSTRLAVSRSEATFGAINLGPWGHGQIEPFRPSTGWGGRVGVGGGANSSFDAAGPVVKKSLRPVKLPGVLKKSLRSVKLPGLF